MGADKEKILRLVLSQLAKEGQRIIPVGVSVRHVHLCAEDLEKLFGNGYQLSRLRMLSQPGQFAAKETVTLEGPKGRLENVRIIGPAREQTQVELSLTDALSIGIKDIPVRMSGKLENTKGIRLIGPCGNALLDSGVISAARHIHFSEEQAVFYGIRDGESVSVKAYGERPCIFEDVVCRVGNGHELEFHIDTDEANAAMLKTGDFVQLILNESKEREGADRSIHLEKISSDVAAILTGSRAPLVMDHGQNDNIILELVTEADINIAASSGTATLFCSESAIITPAANDRALQKKITIIRKELANKVDNRPLDGTKPLELITANELNAAFRDEIKQLYCTHDAIITPAARERIEETGIRIIRL